MAATLDVPPPYSSPSYNVAIIPAERPPEYSAVVSGVTISVSDVDDHTREPRNVTSITTNEPRVSYVQTRLNQLCRSASEIILIVIIASFFGAFGLIELIYGSIYIDSVICDSFMSPADWLIVSGSVTLVIVILETWIYLKTGTPANCSRGMYGTFCIVWMIVGAVILWRDCPHMSPKSIQELFYVHIIFVILGFILGAYDSK